MLPLPINPGDALAQIINPVLDLLPQAMRSDEARVLMLAIGLQESGLAARAQLNGGPALGLWQNEQGGMVRGVLKSTATRSYALALCEALGVPATEAAVWDALEDDDLLAGGIARLGLWADPLPLPAIGDAHSGWLCYARNWRPGKPRPGAWGDNYDAACAAVRGA